MAIALGILALLSSFWKDLGELFSDSKGRSLILWVVILLVFGTIFYSQVEGWSLVDSFYFSVVTLTTVGYGDLTPDTPVGKLATTIYIFFGLSVIGVFASSLVKSRAHRIERRASGDGSGQNPDRSGSNMTIQRRRRLAGREMTA